MDCLNLSTLDKRELDGGGFLGTILMDLSRASDCI